CTGHTACAPPRAARAHTRSATSDRSHSLLAACATPWRCMFRYPAPVLVSLAAPGVGAGLLPCARLGPTPQPRHLLRAERCHTQPPCSVPARSTLPVAAAAGPVSAAGAAVPARLPAGRTGGLPGGCGVGSAPG